MERGELVEPGAGPVHSNYPSARASRGCGGHLGGKTSTLGLLVEELRRRSERILFVSNTNAAFDTALLRFAHQSDDYGLGDVVRVGPSALAEVAKLPTPVTTEAISAERGHHLAKALQACQADLESLKESNLASIALIDGSAPPADDSDDSLLQVARRRDSNYDNARATAPLVGFLVERRRLLRDLLSHMEQGIYNHGRVLFATVHQAYLRRLEGQRFDCVIVDEASMVSVDLALIAAGLSDHRVVVAGDFRQLGPIMQTDSLQARPWLGESIFEPLQRSRSR